MKISSSPPPIKPTATDASAQVGRAIGAVVRAADAIAADTHQPREAVLERAAVDGFDGSREGKALRAPVLSLQAAVEMFGAATGRHVTLGEALEAIGTRSLEAIVADPLPLPPAGTMVDEFQKRRQKGNRVFPWHTQISRGLNGEVSVVIKEGLPTSRISHRAENIQLPSWMSVSLTPLAPGDVATDQVNLSALHVTADGGRSFVADTGAYSVEAFITPILLDAAREPGPNKLDIFAIDIIATNGHHVVNHSTTATSLQQAIDTLVRKAA